ncbi:MAG: metallophosphoesterase [Candidatus Aenigmatarchaeota archaeon]
MNLLIISDIHNDIENLLTYLDKITLLDFDVIICPGDLTDIIIPKGFSRTEIAKIIINELKILKKPLLMVPGNMDAEIISLLEEEDISLHGRGKVINNVGFYGYGGAKTPFNTPLEVTEEELKKGLEKAYNEVKNSEIKVQVTHMPPIGTNLDKIVSGAHVGSQAIRDFIEKHKPEVAISAHIHEAKGIDRLNDTILINSGRFPEGNCGLISLKNGKAEAKIISLI